MNLRPLGGIVLATMLSAAPVAAQTTLHDFSNRVSLTQKRLIAGFNGNFDGFEPGEGVTLDFTDASPFGCKPHEGTKALLVKPADNLKANQWRTVTKRFDKPLDLRSTPMLEFAVFTQEGPAVNQFVRLVLSDGKRTFEAQAQFIPTLWRTIMFDLSECKFLKNVRSMEIGVMCNSQDVWASGRDFMLDGIYVGKPLDLNFMLPASTDRFTATGGKISHADDALVFKFNKAGAAVATTELKGSYNSIYNPPIGHGKAYIRMGNSTDHYPTFSCWNTFFIVMANQSPATKARLSFITDKDSVFSADKSKEFSLTPNSGLTGYYVNLTDVPTAGGRLMGFKLEPVDAAKGSWAIDRITFEREDSIFDFAGQITSCTADSSNLHISGMVKPEYVEQYKRLAIYEYPFHKSSQPISKLRLVYEGPATEQFKFDELPNSRHGGKMTHLSTRFLAVVKNSDTDWRSLAKPFYVENWEDFTTNPYAFSLPDVKFNVLDYGAKGDGFTDDTPAIQKAIDACTAAGGGQVVLPGSDSPYGRRYRATNIILKSNVDLHLDKGAIIWQDCDMRHYKYHMLFGHDMAIPNTPWTHCLFINLPLIQANDVKNVKVTGPGVIRMYDQYTENPDWFHYARTCTDRMHVCALAFSDCENIEVTNIDEVRANNYHTNFQTCRNVFVGNVRLYEVACVSGDGFSFGQGSKHVKVERCFFDSNDDGIVLSSSYGDPRGKVSPWRRDYDDRDHKVSDVTVEHSYINSATGGGGKAIALIPWGSTNPDQTKQGLDSVQVYDCVLAGGYSVGTWADNPFDGKPFTNAEQDDYCPVSNFKIFNNEYIDACDLLWVHPTTFLNDCGIKSSDKFVNADFAQGNSYWTMQGDANAVKGYGYANNGGTIWEGLYLAKGTYTFTAETDGNGSLQVCDLNTGKQVADQAFANSGWGSAAVTFTIDADGDYSLGLKGGTSAKMRNCQVAKAAVPAAVLTPAKKVAKTTKRKKLRK